MALPSKIPTVLVDPENGVWIAFEPDDPADSCIEGSSEGEAIQCGGAPLKIKKIPKCMYSTWG